MAGTPATLLVVSHDRRLLEKVCNSLWVVDDGLAVQFDGGYRAWRAAVADGWTVKAAAESEARRMHGGRSAPDGRRPGAAVGSSARKSEARSAGGAAASVAPSSAAAGSGSAGVAQLGGAERAPIPKLSKEAYRRRKSQLDEDLAHLNARKRQLEEALQDPSVHGNFLELRRVSGELATVDQALAAAEESWLQTEEAAP
jgi:ATPase subunit of ABC transporter with duplicated ATPase domains